MTRLMVSAAKLVDEHWGDQAPAWVYQLASACDKTTQAAAAREIRRSGALVNQVLKNRYPGNLKDVEARVKAAFNTDKIACPVLGEITSPSCLDHRTAPFNPSNFVGVRLYRACRLCPHNPERGGAK